jgi:Zn-dependent M16 (insulinase) family peptidase
LVHIDVIIYLFNSDVKPFATESRQAVQTRADQLSQSQQSVQDIDVLPTLRRSDIATSTPAYVVNDVSVTNVAVQVCPQPTNGIAYFKASLDIEKLLPGAGLSWTQWDLLPVLSQLTTSMATESRSAEQLALDMNRFTGGVHATPSILPGAFQPTSGLSSIAKFQAAQSLASPLNWPSPKAYWTISSHALQRNADQMMKLSAELFAQVRHFTRSCFQYSSYLISGGCLESFSRGSMTSSV